MNEEPNLRKLTLVAAVCAAIALVLFVLPAEYGVDPTGVGGALGIKSLGGDPEPTTRSELGPAETLQETIRINSGRGTEYKVVMEEGQTFTYGWTIRIIGNENETRALYYDFHGEPRGADPGVFQSYEIDTQATAYGSFQAPFAGTHGWYWNNDSPFDVEITLDLHGYFEPQG